jgi:hypothetical protein
MPDGTLCFKGDGGLTWTVICEDGRSLSTVTIDYSTFTENDNAILGNVYKELRKQLYMLFAIADKMMVKVSFINVWKIPHSVLCVV